MMNSTLIDFNTCKHSILVMFVIGFMVNCCTCDACYWFCEEQGEEYKLTLNFF